MSDSSYTQMMILMGFVFFLLAAIFGTIIFSVLKKNKAKIIIEDQIEDQDVLKSAAPFQEKEISLMQALAKTEENFFGRIKKAFANSDKNRVLEEIEEILYTSDLGPQTVEKLLDVVKSELSVKDSSDIQTVKLALQNEMHHILQPTQDGFEKNKTLQDQITKSLSGPTVLMIVGVMALAKRHRSEK